MKIIENQIRIELTNTEKKTIIAARSIIDEIIGSMERYGADAAKNGDYDVEFTIEGLRCLYDDLNYLDVINVIYKTETKEINDIKEDI